MILLKAFGVGFAFTLGMEVALGFIRAIRIVSRGNRK